jgi:2-oxoglutarate ferredoxin oxidoreductase subunit beta
MGSIDEPVNPLALALAAECTFVARCIDVDVKMLGPTMERAAGHAGCAFIEVYQDCNIFNHQAWFYASQKDTRPNNTVDLVHGEPLIFGENRDKGVMIVNGRPRAVTLGTGGVTEKDLLVHDETDRTLAFTLANMRSPELPEPLGVLYCNPDRPAYEQESCEQIRQAQQARPDADLATLVAGPDTWTVG